MKARSLFLAPPRRGTPVTLLPSPLGDNYAIEYIHAASCRRHHSDGPCRRTVFRRDGECSRRPCELELSGLGWDVEHDNLGYHHRAGFGDCGFSRGHYHCTGFIDGSDDGGWCYGSSTSAT
jgi:hypothetical protein